MQSDPQLPETRQTKPYPPSYLDRFMDFVQRLPIPYWLTYLLLFILESAVFHLFAWVDGWLPAYTFSPVALTFPIWQWAPLAIITYLNSTSLEALTNFSPLLELDEEGLQQLKDEFTTMPSRGVLLNGLVWSIMYILLAFLVLKAFYAAYGVGTFFAVFAFLVGLVTYFTGSAIYYHSLRQLRLVSRTVKMVKQFNLFHLDPVYAFSRLTSRTGMSWMLMLSLTLLVFPLQLISLLGLAILLVQVVLALAAFVLPLQFVNNRLVAEKRRLLAELNRRLEAILGRLNRCLDEDKLAELSELNSAVSALNAERDALTRIPTWPWRSGTLTGFLSAVGLPILLYLLQLVIGKWLGG